jgi:hypothetical protein
MAPGTQAAGAPVRRQQAGEEQTVVVVALGALSALSALSANLLMLHNRWYTLCKLRSYERHAQ